MKRNKISFIDACKIWWKQPKGIVEGFTLEALAIIAVQALFYSCIEFATLRWLGWLWNKIKGNKHANRK